jgi:uncharacterized protein YdaU (DUF1376 family)
MSRQWMPLYVADYLRDTRKLTAAEHGAYLLLIMEYWTSGELPDDDRQLARIASMSPAEWKKARPNVQGFFHDGWSHKRLDIEIARSTDISNKRAAAAKLKHSNSSANAELLDTHARTFSQSPSPSKEDSEPDGSGAEAPPDPSDPERQLFVRGRGLLGKSAGGQIAKLLKTCGGNVALARSKLELGATKQNAAEFVAGVIRAGPVQTASKPLTQHQIERENSRRILDDLDQFANGSSGGEADIGLLRFDPGDGSESIYGGVRGAAIAVPVRGSAKGD